MNRRDSLSKIPSGKVQLPRTPPISLSSRSESPHSTDTDHRRLGASTRMSHTLVSEQAGKSRLYYDDNTTSINRNSLMSIHIYKETTMPSYADSGNLTLNSMRNYSSEIIPPSEPFIGSRGRVAPTIKLKPLKVQDSTVLGGGNFVVESVMCPMNADGVAGLLSALGTEIKDFGGKSLHQPVLPNQKGDTSLLSMSLLQKWHIEKSPQRSIEPIHFEDEKIAVFLTSVQPLPFSESRPIRDLRISPRVNCKVPIADSSISLVKAGTPEQNVNLVESTLEVEKTPVNVLVSDESVAVLRAERMQPKPNRKHVQQLERQRQKEASEQKQMHSEEIRERQRLAKLLALVEKQKQDRHQREKLAEAKERELMDVEYRYEVNRLEREKKLLQRRAWLHAEREKMNMMTERRRMALEENLIRQTIENNRQITNERGHGRKEFDETRKQDEDFVQEDQHSMQESSVPNVSHLYSVYKNDEMTHSQSESYESLVHKLSIMQMEQIQYRDRIQRQLDEVRITINSTLQRHVINAEGLLPSREEFDEFTSQAENITSARQPPQNMFDTIEKADIQSMKFDCDKMQATNEDLLNQLQQLQDQLVDENTDVPVDTDINAFPDMVSSQFETRDDEFVSEICDDDDEEASLFASSGDDPYLDIVKSTLHHLMLGPPHEHLIHIDRYSRIHSDCHVIHKPTISTDADHNQLLRSARRPEEWTSNLLSNIAEEAIAIKARCQNGTNELFPLDPQELVKKISH